jgi:hypothetical protein
MRTSPPPLARARLRTLAEFLPQRVLVLAPGGHCMLSLQGIRPGVWVGDSSPEIGDSSILGSYPETRFVGRVSTYIVVFCAAIRRSSS